MRAPIFYDSNNTAYYVDPASTSILNKVYYDSNMVSRNFGIGQVGLYDSFRYQAVFSMGESYLLPANGTNTGNLYGIAWSHPNTGGAAANLASHGMLILENGGFAGAWGGGSFRTPGDVRGTIFYDWNNTAFYTDPASTSVLNGLTVGGFELVRARTQGNWAGSGVIDNVVGLLAWKNYGSGHVIFDASNGTTPSGGSCNNTNPQNNWTGTYPTLMGWNGANTYGVRVDSARVADSAGAVDFANLTNKGSGTGTYTTSGDFRAPIFYDSNNTGFYTDPNGTSNLNQLLVSGDGDRARIFLRSSANVPNDLWFGANGTNHWSLSSRDASNPFFGLYNNNIGDWAFTVNYSTNGVSFTNDIQLGANYLRFDQSGTRSWNINAASGNLRFNSGDNSGRHVFTAGGIEAAIFYDTNNTAFYFDGSATGDSIRVAGDVVAYFSDERLKDIKENIPNALDKVLSLNGFYYEPNEKAQELGYKKKLEVGVSAQEVERILPEIIKDAPIGQGYKTLDYGKLTPLLIEAIKEQQQQINKLTELINNLTK
jgi:hypothetical protein